MRAETGVNEDDNQERLGVCDLLHDLRTLRTEMTQPQAYPDPPRATVSREQHAAL
jgi:hypothetical protein